METSRPSPEQDPRQVYADIIGLPRHQSSRHPHMSLHDRAAQFAPFAALVGYDEMIDEEARLTESRIDPGEADLERLDRRIRRLSEALSAGCRPEISVSFFEPDPHKAGGSYRTVSGALKKIDPYEKKLVLLEEGSSVEGISLDMDRILDITGGVPDGMD